MVDLYATLIIKKKRTFDSIPPNLKEDVKEELLNRGYDENGDPLVPND
jgi:hypothetical protein